MDLHELLEAGKAKVLTASGEDINFDLIVHEVKDDLFKTHIKMLVSNDLMKTS